MATTDATITAEEFAAMDIDQPCELVRGQIVMMNVPGARHGQVCDRVSELLHLWQHKKKIGHVLSNDSGVVLARGPDTVRGPDVSFISFERLPRGRLPRGYPEVPPQVVFEVVSPSDRWAELIEKAADYLKGGVTAVCILDPDDESVHVYKSVQSPQRYVGKQIVELPAPLDRFRKSAAEFFDDQDE